MKNLLFTTLFLTIANLSFAAKLECELFCEGKNLNQEQEGIYLTVEGKDEHDVMIKSISECRGYDKNGRLFADNSRMREITLSNVKSYCRKK